MRPPGAFRFCSWKWAWWGKDCKLIPFTEMYGIEEAVSRTSPKQNEFLNHSISETASYFTLHPWNDSIVQANPHPFKKILHRWVWTQAMPALSMVSKKWEGKTRLRNRLPLATSISRVHRAFSITHSDSGTRESALQISRHHWEAIIVKMLLKYGANYVFKQQSKLFPLLLLEPYKASTQLFANGPQRTCGLETMEGCREDGGGPCNSRFGA